jgi:hypothetical protein
LHDLDQDGFTYAVEQMSPIIGQIAGAILASVDKLENEDGSRAPQPERNPRDGSGVSEICSRFAVTSLN